MNLNIPDLIWATVNFLLLIGITIVIVNFLRLPGKVKEITERIDEIEVKLDKIIEKNEDA